MAYTSTTLVQNLIGRTLTANETAFLAILIPAIKIWIDKKTSSTFDTAAETSRRYDGTGGRSLDIDPCTDITNVRTVDAEGDEVTDYTSGTDYVAEPYNQTIKRELRLRGRGFPKGVANVEVTAKFSEYGDTNAVPEDIQAIATQMAAAVLQSGTGTADNIKSESLEGHSITYGDVSETLDAVGNGDPFVQTALQLRRDLLVG